MQINDRQPIDVQDTPETLDPAELRRAAHKIAWARMNGSSDAANPFVEAGPNRLAPEGRAKRE
jgi:hypothetical protein